MKQHPVDGHRLLLEKGAVGEIPLDVCLHHHEKMDGSGYPDGLAGARHHPVCRMGAVCDVYDAITSNRPYKSGWDPGRIDPQDGRMEPGAFRRAGLPGFREKHRHLSGRFAGAARVRAAGRGGRAGAQIAPDAAGRSFRPRSQTYIPPEIIDLARPRVRDKIVGREDAAQWGIKDFDSCSGRRPDQAVSRSRAVSQASACSRVSPHISADGRSPAQQAGPAAPGGRTPRSASQPSDDGKLRRPTWPDC